MPPQPKENTNAMSLADQIKLVKWFTRFPALSVIVFLRPDVGYRMLHPLAIGFASLIIFIFAVLFFKEDARPEDLLVFSVVMLGLASAQRFVRWRQIAQCVKQHSYYLGTSCFQSLPWPSFVRRNGRINRYIDPAFCGIVGIVLIPYSRALAIWLIFSGLCLRLYEEEIYRREFHQMLDTVDGLITSTVQSDIVERFETPSNSNATRQSQGIPTGLGRDIEQHVEQRKRNPPS